jgi:HipA-like protein
MAQLDQLRVYHGDEWVGTVHNTSPIAFEYTPTWLVRPGHIAIAAIALQPGLQDSAAVQAFFENLLPEGELRAYLAEHKIGGVLEPGLITKTQLADLAKQLGMRPQFLAQQARELAVSLPGALEKAVQELKPVLPEPAKTLADPITAFCVVNHQENAGPT